MKDAPEEREREDQSALRIETPENVDFHFDLAGIGSRAIAFLIDAAIIFLVCVVILMIAVSAQLPVWFISEGTSIWITVFFGTLLFLVIWGYFPFFEMIWNGQTPGKRALHLRVLSDGGYPVSFFQTLVRNLLRIVDVYLCPAIGIIAMFWSRRSKRLGDIVAGTIVVREKKLSIRELEALGYSKRVVRSTEGAKVRLEPAEFEALEGFLRRREAFEAEIRKSLARRLAAGIAWKVSDPQGSLLNLITKGRSEEFIERVVALYRSSKGQVVG